MRGRSSSKRSKVNSTTTKVERPKLRGDRRLSSAYIRSLVKAQLRSSSSPEPTNQNLPGGSPLIAGESFNLQRPGDQDPITTPKPKKQVRRRLHTRPPHQEMLLNMAEARREIITALKFHRAAMKQANERQKQQNLHQPPASAPSSEESSLGLVLESLKSNAIFHPKPMASSYPYLSYPLSESSPVSQILHLHQLNVHEFAAETSVFSSGKAPPSQSLSSSSSSSTAANSNPSVDPALHPAMGDEEMAEIRSVSEKHDIEWDDMMSLVTTARWSKFLKAMEVDRGDNGGGGGEGLEIPPWLNDGIVMDDRWNDDFYKIRLIN